MSAPFIGHTSSQRERKHVPTCGHGRGFCVPYDRPGQGSKAAAGGGGVTSLSSRKFFKSLFPCQKNFPKKPKNPLDSATIKIYTVYTIDTVHTIHTIYNAYVIYTVSITYNKNPLPPTKQKQGIVTSNHHSHRELIIFYQLFRDMASRTEKGR